MPRSVTIPSSSNVGSGDNSPKMTGIYAEQVSSEDAIKAYKPIVIWEGGGLDSAETHSVTLTI